MMSQAEMFVLRQPLKRRRDGLGDRIRRIGDALQMRGHPVEKVAGGAYGGGHQQCVRAGEVPIHRLTGHPERARDIGDGEVGALDVDRLARRGQDARNGFVVAGGRCADQPWVRTRES